MATHENTTAFIDTVDLENALREVDTDRSKLGHGWLLSVRRQHPDYAPTQTREQEPSTPSVENLWQFMRDNWLGNRIFQSYADILDHCCHAWNTLINRPERIMSIGSREWAYGF
ncbi:hypothetical protein CFIICLFH_4250 [Methylobacterium goesingense]|nr:hypothetical protein CFIICLFH_4250 [Methylobacterium goesingense]